MQVLVTIQVSNKKDRIGRTPENLQGLLPIEIVARCRRNQMIEVDIN